MMFCPDCKTNLDDVPVGDACPGCGGKRRSTIAAVGVAAAAVVAHPPVIARAVAGAIDASLDADGLTFVLTPFYVAGVFFAVVQAFAGAATGAIAGALAGLASHAALRWEPSRQVLHRAATRLRQ
jgi:hypothetical protein